MPKRKNGSPPPRVAPPVHKGPRKPGRPVTTGRSPTVAVRWPKALFEALEAYAQSECLDRSAAIKGIVGKFLVREGKLDASDL
jgi:hypothetical protein